MRVSRAVAQNLDGEFFSNPRCLIDHAMNANEWRPLPPKYHLNNIYYYIQKVHIYIHTNKYICIKHLYIHT